MATRTEQDQDELLGTSPEVLREQALRRLTKRRELKTHAVAFTLVNLTVWGIWAVIAATSGSSWPWPVFLTLFWGIGLAMNAWDVYFRKPITEQELKRELDRLESSD
jgi:2TM domain